MREVYNIESFEQFEIMTDPDRWRILMYLMAKPMGVSQVARELNISQPRAYYHLKKMEDAGLICCEEERLSNGMVNKCFRAVAKNIMVRPLIETLQENESFDHDEYKSDQVMIRLFNCLLSDAKKDLEHPNVKLDFKNRIPFARQQFFILSKEEVSDFSKKLADALEFCR